MEKIVDYLHGDWSDIHSNWKQHALTQICANMAKLNEIIEWIREHDGKEHLKK